MRRDTKTSLESVCPNRIGLAHFDHVCFCNAVVGVELGTSSGCASFFALIKKAKENEKWQSLFQNVLIVNLIYKCKTNGLEWRRGVQYAQKVFQ